jgi:hypothetical protein
MIRKLERGFKFGELTGEDKLPAKPQRLEEQAGGGTEVQPPLSAPLPTVWFIRDHRAPKTVALPILTLPLSRQSQEQCKGAGVHTVRTQESRCCVLTWDLHL